MRYLFILSCWIATVAHADTFFGRVVAISDGDTLTMIDTTRQQHKIRLQGIDAPESKQPFGQRSKQHLSKLAFGKEVTAECRKKDKYRREICKVLVEGQDVNRTQLEAGLAWWYRKYVNEQSAADRVFYEAAEDSAKAARLGLWADPAPIAPWDWRGKRH